MTASDWPRAVPCRGRDPQLDLFEQLRPRPGFDGRTFVPRLDGARLRGMLDQVRNVMADGRWRTVAEIRTAVGGSDASITARLRDLRKQRFGGFTVDRRRRGGLASAELGVHEYRVHR